MWRMFCALVVCLGIQFSSFCEEKVSEFGFLKECLEKVCDNPCLGYIGAGNLHVLLKDFDVALQDYNKAVTYIDPFEYYGAIANFWVLFGRIVAYDNLGMRQKAEEDIGRLILLTQEWADEDEDDDDDDEDDDEAYEFMTTLMTRIASLAVSEDIKNFLLSIIEDDEDDAIGAEKI